MCSTLLMQGSTIESILIMEFVLLWRNKWLTSDARTIGDMANCLEAAADELREMEARGVILDLTSDIDADFATLLTDDPEVAEEFGFEEFICDECRARLEAAGLSVPASSALGGT